MYQCEYQDFYFKYSMMLNIYIYIYRLFCLSNQESKLDFYFCIDIYYTTKNSLKKEKKEYLYVSMLVKVCFMSNIRIIRNKINY